MRIRKGTQLPPLQSHRQPRVAGSCSLQRAALLGLVAGVFVLAYIKFGTSIAYTWYALIGSLVTFVVGVLASQVWPRSAGERDRESGREREQRVGIE